MAWPSASRNYSTSTFVENTTDLYGIDEYGSFYRVDSPRLTSALDLKVLGVNSEALTGRVNCALVHYRQESPTTPLHMELLHHDQILIPLSIQASILRMVHETSLDPSKRPHIHAQLGHLVSAVIEAFLKNHNISNASIDLIGSRNQPARLSSAPEQVEVPLEECSKQETIIATQTGITTVTDLRRWADQYSTGHDAHVVQNEGVLLRQATNLRACQNIGPVATLSLLSSQRGNNTHAILDWNCGVGTMFIDAAMRYYTRGQLDNDNDGEWGAQGSVNQCVVDRTLENNKYINDLNQQSTGRETPVDNEAQALIEECLFLGMSNYDTIATITRITAQNIATQYRDVMLKYLTADQKIDEIVVCGPGARNKNIISFLRSELSDTTIRATDYLGISSLSASEEAVSIAQQAFDAILATRPGAEPSQAFEQGLATAKIAPGERWTQLVEQTMRFGQGNPRPNPHRVGVDEVSEIRSSLQDCKL